MTKGQVRRSVGVILAEGSDAVGACSPGGTKTRDQGQGQDPGHQGPSVRGRKPQETFKTTSSRKVKAGVAEHASNTVTLKAATEDQEFKVIHHHVDFEASLGYVRLYPLSAKI